MLRKEQLVKESFMMGRNTKYKEDRFMIPLESRAGSQDQCTGWACPDEIIKLQTTISKFAV